MFTLYKPEVCTRVLLQLIIYSTVSPNTYLSFVLIAEIQLALRVEGEEIQHRK